MLNTHKVVIIGAGHVGSHVALALIQSGEADDIVLIDNETFAVAQAMDLDDAVSGSVSGRDVRVRTGTYDDLNDADILVMAFGRSRRPGETRLDQLSYSLAMADDVIMQLQAVQFNGIMISISNPADIICEYIRWSMGWNRQRCFSTGTSLDTFRLISAVAGTFGCSRSSVQGFCMGEHGASGFVVWSHVYINGISLQDFMVQKPQFRTVSLDHLQQVVRQAGDLEIKGKGSTEYGIGNVANLIISAIFHDQKLLWPCSVSLKGEYGQTDVAAGIPCIIGRQGIEGVCEISLTEEERQQFVSSCQIIRKRLEWIKACYNPNSGC